MLIYSRNGIPIQVDAEDYEKLAQLNWRVDKDGYARTQASALGTEFMHRYIAGASKGIQVDHIDGDPCNNRRSNLRLVTQRQNSHNVHHSKKPCGYKGVTVHSKYKNRTTKRYEAKLNTKDAYGRNMNFYGGLWDTPEEAAVAYDILAMTYLCNDHMCLNFPGDYDT